jgi:AcrR family transcriptional regulator
VASAERLFAEHGVDGVSLRAINADAEVGPAAVHYHFGSKRGLVDAVVRERATVVLDRVRAHVERLAARPRPATARELVEVIAGPYVELLASQPVGGLRWIKLVAQLALADADLIGRVAAEIEPAILEQVARAFPHVDPRVLRVRWALTAQTLIQMLSQIDRWHDEGGRPRARYWHYVDELVAFAAGGLNAVQADTLRGSVRLVPQPSGQ